MSFQTPEAPPRVVHDRRIRHVQKLQPVRLRRPGQNWIVAATTLMFGAAGVNICWGILALAEDAYWGGDPLHYGGVNTFGWLFLTLALVELTVAMLVILGSYVGAAVGILMALGSAVLHIATTRAHPVASGALLAVDLFIVVVLAVYGFRRPV
jgi:hypothetical protein